MVSRKRREKVKKKYTVIMFTLEEKAYYNKSKYNVTIKILSSLTPSVQSISPETCPVLFGCHFDANFFSIIRKSILFHNTHTGSR